MIFLIQIEISDLTYSQSMTGFSEQWFVEVILVSRIFRRNTANNIYQLKTVLIVFQ